MTERPGTGSCDVAAVRRPSQSLVFYKEKRDKKYLKLNFSVFHCVLNRKRRNCCFDSVDIQPEAAQVPSSTSSHQDFMME